MIWSTTSDESLFRSFVTVSPADEQIFSEGTDVAGTVNTRLAITDNRGYLVEWGFFRSQTCRADNFVTLARLEFQTWLEIRWEGSQNVL
jgi:hypothetical protein